MMDYHERMSRAIDIQAHIRALEEDFPELVDIEPNYIQIKWEAFSVLFKDDSYVDVHFFEGGYEHKRGWYNGVYIVTCREVRPDEDNLARLILILAVIAWAIIVVSVLVTPVNADAVPIAEPQEDDGRIPGDDVPATERCYMTDEEVQESFENENIQNALLAKANKIEDVKVSHYCCCVKCCGKDDGITYSGVKATPGVTVAVDTSIIPLGSDVLVDYGDGILNYYRADDTGSAIKGNKLDLCVSSHQEAINLGVRTATVYWVEAD